MVVTIYTTEICPACNMLKVFLDNKQIEYDMKVVGKDLSAEEFQAETNSMSVPVTDVDGIQVIGLDMEKLSKLLNI